jgi:hypothetical protein
MGTASVGENGQRTALSTPDNAICNGHPSDAGGADLSRRYYKRELRSLSKGDVVVVGEVPLAVASIGWTPVRGGLNEVRTSEHGTRPLPIAAPGRARPDPGETLPEGDGS